MIEPLPTTVHSFLYVHIRFRTIRIAIRPNWNDYYIYIYYYNWVKWYELSGSHLFLCLFTDTTKCTTCLWMEASFCLMPRRVYVWRIYSSILKDLKFDRSIQVRWKQRVIVNQIHLSKRFSLEHIRWYSNTKADKYFSCYLVLPPSGQLVCFYKADYYCIILSHYLHAEVLQNRCLKSLAQFAEKYLCRSIFLISQ